MKIYFLVLLIAFSSLFTYSHDEKDLEKLKKGEDCKGCDLSGIDLSGANLSGANLSGVNLSGANLSEANIKGSTLEKKQQQDQATEALKTASKFEKLSVQAANLRNVATAKQLEGEKEITQAYITLVKGTFSTMKDTEGFIAKFNDGTSLENLSKSHKFGITAIFFGFCPHFIMPSFIPGDRATIPSEYLYDNASSLLAKNFRKGFFNAPISIGNSGHKSLTSKTNFMPVKNLHTIAGIDTVNGVLVA